MRTLFLFLFALASVQTFGAVIGGGDGGGTGSITNLPSYVITNNQTTVSTLSGGVSSPFLVTPAQVLGVNAHLNGSVAVWKTNLLGNLAVVLTNMSEDVEYSLLVSNPATYTVNFNMIALQWVQFQDGSSPIATTNGYTHYKFRRWGTVTNGWVAGREKPAVAGANITFTENENSITVAAANQITPLTIGNVANEAALSNAMFLRVSSNIIHSVATGLNGNGTSAAEGTNILDFDIGYTSVTLTNDFRFRHSTNRLAGAFKVARYKFFAGGTNRWIFVNANWKGLGTTNNAEVVALFLETNKTMRVTFEVDGVNETNVVVYAAKQQFP